MEEKRQHFFRNTSFHDQGSSIIIYRGIYSQRNLPIDIHLITIKPTDRYRLQELPTNSTLSASKALVLSLFESAPGYPHPIPSILVLLASLLLDLTNCAFTSLPPPPFLSSSYSIFLQRRSPYRHPVTINQPPEKATEFMRIAYTPTWLRFHRCGAFRSCHLGTIVFSSLTWLSVIWGWSVACFISNSMCESDILPISALLALRSVTAFMIIPFSSPWSLAVPPTFPTRIIRNLLT